MSRTYSYIAILQGKSGRDGLETDLEKTYDILEWKFIEDTLRDASLPRKMVDVITKMLRMSSCKLLWNGKSTGKIRLTRGLRQGNPMSPYLFMLCMDPLSQWIISKVKQGVWNPLKTSKGGVKLLHLFFADDFLLLLKQNMIN